MIDVLKTNAYVTKNFGASFSAFVVGTSRCALIDSERRFAPPKNSLSPAFRSTFGGTIPQIIATQTAFDSVNSSPDRERSFRTRARVVLTPVTPYVTDPVCAIETKSSPDFCTLTNTFFLGLGSNHSVCETGR